MKPLDARRALRLQCDKPAPRPLLLERAQPEKSRVLEVIIQGVKVAAILVTLAIVSFFLFRSW